MTCYSLDEVKKMDIQVLRYFLAVAREENITRAEEIILLVEKHSRKSVLTMQK